MNKQNKLERKFFLASMYNNWPIEKKIDISPLTKRFVKILLFIYQNHCKDQSYLSGQWVRKPGKSGEMFWKRKIKSYKGWGNHN